MVNTAVNVYGYSICCFNDQLIITFKNRKLMKYCILILSLLLAHINLVAQDYLISFSGSGASTKVDSVKVENLTQGTSLTIKGLEVLHLMGKITGIEQFNNIITSFLRIYPNPTTTDNSNIEFTAITSSTTSIELFDITGKRVVSTQGILSVGNHSFNVSGLGRGIFMVRVSSQANNYTGKLVSTGTSGSTVKISYNGCSEIQVTSQKLKSANNEICNYSVRC
jgi:hypothetical protein